MKAVIQRVRDASVTVGGNISGRVKKGLLVYLGVASGDTEKDAEYMAEKATNLRIFLDADGKMNLSLLDLLPRSGEEPVGVLAVSQFTLLADARKGRRPYYGAAAEPEEAKNLYELFMEKVRARGLACEAGVFGARMDLTYTNEGPVTILLDSRET